MMDLPPEKLLNLIDENPLPLIEKSTSFLRIIAYPSSSETVDEDACPIDQDLGLITLIPRSTEPLLEIYDFEKNAWVNAELSLNKENLLVLIGETLSFLSNQYFLPCTHRIRKISKPRISLIYQVRVKPDVWLDSNDFVSVITGHFPRSFRMTGLNFYQKEKMMRASINGSY